MLKRLANLSALVAIAALIVFGSRLSAAPDSGGVIRVKSSYGFNETVMRLKADIQAKKITIFNEIDQASPIDAARVRQSAAWHTIHDVQSRVWSRLACTASRDSGRVWRGVDGLYRLPVDR
jgi:hypothetical protein